VAWADFSVSLAGLVADVGEQFVMRGLIWSCECTRGQGSTSVFIHLTHDYIVHTFAYQWAFLALRDQLHRHGLSSLCDGQATCLVGLNEGDVDVKSPLRPRSYGCHLPCYHKFAGTETGLDRSISLTCFGTEWILRDWLLPVWPLGSPLSILVCGARYTRSGWLGCRLDSFGGRWRRRLNMFGRGGGGLSSGGGRTLRFYRFYYHRF